MLLPRIARSLSARLLVLTALFVMLAEVLIYTPSIARFRLGWLDDRLSVGRLAVLATVAAPEGMVTEELERELLAQVGAYFIYLRRPGQTLHVLGREPPLPVTCVVDLTDRNVADLIGDAFDTMINGQGRVIRLIGTAMGSSDAAVEIVLDESPLREAMLDFSWRILALSVIISLITAGLVFLALRWLTVRPLLRLAEKMMAFRRDPDDAASVIVPSRRSDEVGIAERELRDMQTDLRTALRQQARLAALGTAVTRINHDLRNILSTAALVSEPLAENPDPTVRRSADRLVKAIDRAVELCSRTLAYTREGGPPLTRATVNLHHLVERAGADLGPLLADRTTWVNAVPEDLTARADADELGRVLVNLGRNAIEAGAETVTVGADATADTIVLTMADDGPGLPPRARAHLFQPFAGSARPGGTGLGLAIAREILAAHKGELRLVDTGAAGTTFRLSLPR